MENNLTVEDVLKMIETEISEKDLELLYVFLDGMYEDLSEAERIVIAHALEKIDKGFYSNE